jgi:hypothetical protein
MPLRMMPFQAPKPPGPNDDPARMNTPQQHRRDQPEIPPQREKVPPSLPKKPPSEHRSETPTTPWIVSRVGRTTDVMLLTRANNVYQYTVLSVEDARALGEALLDLVRTNIQTSSRTAR